MFDSGARVDPLSSLSSLSALMDNVRRYADTRALNILVTGSNALVSA